MRKDNEVYTVLKNISDENYRPGLVLFQGAPGSGKKSQFGTSHRRRYSKR